MEHDIITFSLDLTTRIKKEYLMWKNLALDILSCIGALVWFSGIILQPIVEDKTFGIYVMLVGIGVVLISKEITRNPKE